MGKGKRTENQNPSKMSDCESDEPLTKKINPDLEKMSDYESDEDDDAPEAVTFSASKSKALDEVKAAAEAIKKSEERVKEEKKKRDERNKKQKEEKAARLEELKKNAPSDDIFDQLPDTFESEPIEPKETEVPTRTEFFEGDEEEEGEYETEDFISLSTNNKRKVKRVKLREKQHGSTKFHIKSSVDSKSAYHISESVLNFKKAKLSGHLSRVKREAAQESLQRAAKQQASGKNTLCLAKTLRLK